MSDNLIERLRMEMDGINGKYVDPVCIEAADALEAKDQRIAELEAALREIKDEVADNFDACAYNIAKQALKGNNDGD